MAEFETQKEFLGRQMAREREQTEADIAELCADITAEKMAEITEAKAVEREQFTIERAVREIVLFAKSGSIRCYHIDSTRPAVATYFRDRGFRVSSTDPQPGILVEW